MTPDERYELLIEERDGLLTAMDEVYGEEVFADVIDKVRELSHGVDYMTNEADLELNYAFSGIRSNLDEVGDDEVLPLAKRYLAAAREGRASYVNKVKRIVENIRESVSELSELLDDESINGLMYDGIADVDSRIEDFAEAIKACERN